MALLLILSLLFIPGAVERVRATDYVEAATEIHRSYLEGPCHSMPLHSPEVVTAWFAGKTHFTFSCRHPSLCRRGKLSTG